MMIEFDRYFLWKAGGFFKENMSQILDLLQPKTEVRALMELVYKDAYAILVSHDTFDELPDGSIYPVITAKFTLPGPDCELIWPESYKKAHTCIYKIYQGFSKTEEVCTICGKTK